MFLFIMLFALHGHAHADALALVNLSQVIAGFDKAVTGLSVGQTRKTRFGPEEAYVSVMVRMGSAQIAHLWAVYGTRVTCTAAQFLPSS